MRAGQKLAAASDLSCLGSPAPESLRGKSVLICPFSLVPHGSQPPSEEGLTYSMERVCILFLRPGPTWKHPRNPRAPMCPRIRLPLTAVPDTLPINSRPAFRSSHPRPQDSSWMNPRVYHDSQLRNGALSSESKI